MAIVADERISKDCILPALTSRRTGRTPLPFQERCSDSWLDRAQELAVQKEACLLFQTDLASLRNRERQRETNTKVSQLGKNVHCANLKENVNVHPSSHTVPKPRDGNLNILENGQDKILNDLQDGYEHIQENSQYSANDRTVPSTPFCLSDCDTTISESLCSDYQVPINPESSSELKPFPEQQIENIITTPDFNNNTNDTSQFAFIDCDSSPSDANQTTFGIINKDRNKGILSGNGFSSVPPEDFSNRMAEQEPLSPKESPDTVVVVAGGMSSNNHYKKPCDESEQNSLQLHSKLTVSVESGHPNHKESSVSPPTIHQQDRDDGSVTAQHKPGATEDNAGLDALQEVGCHLIYDKSKIKAAELQPEADSSDAHVAESNKISESPSSLTDGISFKDLHAQVAPRGSSSPSKTEVKSARIRTCPMRNHPKNDPSATLSSDPSQSSLVHRVTTRPGLGSAPAEASYNASTLQLQATAEPTLTPEEAEAASSRPPTEESR